MFGILVSAISAAVATVCTTVASIGSAVANFATTIAPIVIDGLKIVADVISIIGKVFGILQPDENIEDVGDRALQAAEAGIHPENYEKYDEYLAEIRAFEIDPEKSKRYTAEEKMLAGAGITCTGIEEKFDLREGSVGQLAVMTALNPYYFNASRLENWIGSGLDIGKVVDYFDKKLDGSESFEIESKIISVEQKNMDKTEKEIEQEIEQAKTDMYQASQQLNS